jgi:hypothetical protein
LESTGLALPHPQFEVVGAASSVMTAALEVKEEGLHYAIKVTIGKDTPPGRYDGLLRVTYPEGSGIPSKEIVLSALVR